MKYHEAAVLVVLIHPLHHIKAFQNVIRKLPSITWVCLKMLCTPKPNGFADHYPYYMAISLGIYPIFRQTHMNITQN